MGSFLVVGETRASRMAKGGSQSWCGHAPAERAGAGWVLPRKTSAGIEENRGLASVSKASDLRRLLIPSHLMLARSAGPYVGLFSTVTGQSATFVRLKTNAFRHLVTN